MRPVAAACLAAACLAAAPAARADDAERRSVAELAVGFGMGGLEVSDRGGLVPPVLSASLALPARPVGLELLATWGAWQPPLPAGVEMLDDDPGDPRRLVRLGAGLRWDFAHVGGATEHNPSLTAYVDTGVGWQHVGNPDGAADRVDVELGVAMEDVFSVRGRPAFGIELAFRFVAAPDDGRSPWLGCRQAPCPLATAPGLDLGGWFTLSVVGAR